MKLTHIDSTAKWKAGDIIRLGPNRMRYKVVKVINHNTMTVVLI